jgi:hypothetical protein
MSGKITEYPNQATSFGVDDKFDVSQKTGVSTYQSRWFSPATLYAQIIAFISGYFVRQLTMSRADLQALISTNSLIINTKYIINDAEGATKYVAVYATSVNTITDYCYIFNNSLIPFYYSSVGRYDIVSDVFYPVDTISEDGYFSLLLYFNGGYFKKGQTIEINNSAQGKVSVFSTDSNSTSVAAMMPGNQDGGNTPDVQGYWGKYDPINDVFVHDIVHFRTEVRESAINAGTPVPVDECSLPPVGYCWEILSANIYREAGDSYGVGAGIEIGILATGRNLYANNTILEGLGAGWRNMLKNDSASNIYKEDQPLEI